MSEYQGRPATDAVEELHERGLPFADPPADAHRVPGDGLTAVPHYQTFSQMIFTASRSYRWAFDEALRHSRANALAIRRDPVVMDALRSRQIPVAQLGWHLEGPDEEDEAQADAIDRMTDVIEEIPNWQQIKMWLLEGEFYGRYGVQLRYEWDFPRGKRTMVVGDDARPINGDKLVFKWDGTAGILVHGTYRGEWELTDRGRAHFFSPRERETILVHHWEPEDADYYEGDLGGSVAGLGIRSRIYWLWWIRNQVFQFMLDYLERVGAGGLTVYYYEAGSTESLKEVKNAAETQFRNNSILFPRYRDGTKGGPGVDRIECGTAGAALIQTLITTYFDEVIRRYILGQNLTSEATGTGLGSGVADLHADTFARLIKYDAVALAETITRDLLRVLCKYNCPSARRLRFCFDIDKPNAADVAEAASQFFEMGGALSEKQLREALGLEEPQPGEPILAQMGSLSPAAAGAMPAGVPMAGPPGPAGAGLPPELMGGAGAQQAMAQDQQGQQMAYSRIRRRGNRRYHSRVKRGAR